MKGAARILLCLALALPGGAVLAQSDPSIAAQRAAQDLQAAATALEDATRAADRIAALTKTIRAYEDGLAALRQSLRRAATREAALRGVFEAERDRLARLLGTLQVMEVSSGPLLLLHPSGPVATARSGMLLSHLTPAVQARAESLRRDLEEVILLRALRESAANTLREGLAGVQQARLALSQAISDRTDLPRRFAEDRGRMQALLEGSETLDAFTTGLSGLPESATAPANPDDPDLRRGAAALPVAGTLLRGYDDADAAGIRRPGWLIATRPLSLVTAPWPATIRYRGPLLDYGKVVILEPDRDMLLILAGLGAVYGETGEIVVAGAPLGLMPAAGRADDGVLTDTGVIDAGVERTETLYMEIRRKQEPVDPADWFALQKD